MNHKGSKHFLPVVMEPAMSNVKQWTGRLARFGNTMIESMFIDDGIFQGNDAAFERRVDGLFKSIMRTCESCVLDFEKEVFCEIISHTLNHFPIFAGWMAACLQCHLTVAG